MKQVNITTISIFLMICSLYATEHHVSPKGLDSNKGTRSEPFKTISAAAAIAQPGDVITVHEGVYRERVNPPRGGASDDQRIVYQAAEGETVIVKGSELVSGWEKVSGDVWKVVLPHSFFGDFNPFDDLIHGDWFRDNRRKHHTGTVYVNGHWLAEAVNKKAVFGSSMAKASSGYLLNISGIKAIGSGLKTIPAANVLESMGVDKAKSSEGGECIGYINGGDWVTYDFDFGKNTEFMQFRVASGSTGGVIEIRLDSPQGTLLGECIVTKTGGWKKWQDVKVPIDPVSGKGVLCLVFKETEAETANASWFAEVDEKNTTIWAQFPKIDPNKEVVEVNARQSVFYPEIPGINYITVRGFTLEHAATPWSPPTAEQIGLIGTHWSKGWIIENNIIRYSICTGVTLGKYGDEFDNKAGSADGYNGTIKRGIKDGWSKELIGHHLVRNNTISNCGQAGIVGSLGAVFSTITGNEIHDIHQDRPFGGLEMAGIKFHGPIDTIISHNHIYRCGGYGGIWLDWMTQGSRVTSNLLHDNTQDLFMEVNHGPFLIDNNLFLSTEGLGVLESSGGGAYCHNLFGGIFGIRREGGRTTPFHRAHSTEILGFSRVSNHDDRYYNNVFAGSKGLSVYGEIARWVSDLKAVGNVYLAGTRPGPNDQDELLVAGFKPELELIKRSDGWWLKMAIDPTWEAMKKRPLVTTELLGKAKVPDAPFVNPDGTPYRLDTDYFGKKRNSENPEPGPFVFSDEKKLLLKVWPKK